MRRVANQRLVEVVPQPFPDGLAIGDQGRLTVEELWWVLLDDAVNYSRSDHQMQELVDGDEPEDGFRRPVVVQHRVDEHDSAPFVVTNACQRPILDEKRFDSVSD
jgi:hypothetical protein